MSSGQLLAQALDSLAYACDAPPVRGRIRQGPEDFRVHELPLLEPDGGGEHAWVRVRKRGLNTPVVAERLARLAGVHSRQVGFAGLKDRHAVTEQWFSVHLPGRSDPDWTVLDDENMCVLQHARHSRKLQRGALRGNRFCIVVRGIEGDRLLLEQRLQHIAKAGVPNYFGEQRFGHNGSNLRTADRLFANPRSRLSRNQRSLALSAARSLLFNRVLACRIEAGNWNHPIAGDALQLEGSRSFFQAGEVGPELVRRATELDIHPTGPLCGRGQAPVAADCLAIENRALAGFADIVAGLNAAGVRHDRRALRVSVNNPAWQWCAEDCLELSFSLPAGSYATAVLRELVDYREDG